jgi:hypothetical protein
VLWTGDEYVGVGASMMGKVSKEDSKLWIYIPPVHTVTFSFGAPKVMIER